MSLPCSMDLVCMNGDFIKGEQLSKCALCRLSPGNAGRDMSHYWSPTLPARRAHTKHPQLEQEKRQDKLRRHLNKLHKKNSRDPNKRKVVRKAANAEKTTEKNIIKATKNSGRRNKDGDHVSAGVITLDTKLQTTRENPIIRLGELEKVRQDAARAGKWLGGLVIRNKHNVGCVVFTEEDYAALVGRLLYPEEKNEQECRGSSSPEVGPSVPGDGQASS